MREGAAERHDRLLSLVRERGSVRVSDLAVLLGVAPVTARRDAEALARKGLLDRVHGSVSWPRHQGPGGIAPGGGGPVLGLLAPAAAYYFAEVIRGAHEAAARLGARLILRVSDYRPEDDASHAAGLLAAGAEGLLLAPAWTSADHPERFGDWIARLPVRTVLLERTGVPGGPLEGMDRVRSDHAYGVLLAMRHLVRLGHRGPRLVARSDSPTAMAVRAGYVQAMAALGIAGAPPVIDSSSAERDREQFERTARELDAAVRAGEATAALVHNDEDAIRLVRRLAELGTRVPEDLALVTYDDEVAALADTPLTAVAPPKRDVGRTAAELLVERLTVPGGAYEGDSEEPPRRHIELLPRLRVRASCGGG